MTTSALPARVVPGALLLWLGLALIAGATGWFGRLPFPQAQIVILSLVAASIVAGTFIAPVRALIDTIPLRALVAFHGVRFVGIWFLVLGARGELSPLFASRAGWGDIVTAAAALALAAMWPAPRWLLLAWNAFGLLDLAVAVGTATWVVRNAIEPGMAPIVQLPLIVVPTFFVPLFAASHVFIFRRLRGR
jgi:hypothetical protein